MVISFSDTVYLHYSQYVQCQIFESNIRFFFYRWRPVNQELLFFIRRGNCANWRCNFFGKLVGQLRCIAESLRCNNSYTKPYETSKLIGWLLVDTWSEWPSLNYLPSDHTLIFEWPYALFRQYRVFVHIPYLMHTFCI